MPTSRTVFIRQQRGAALLTAMIIVTLVATLAAAMVWQQWRAVQVEAAERARVQAAWILSGALDFAKLILREDLKSVKGRTMTALTEPWATPLAESRLSTFLAVDKTNADDGPEAFLSGDITDAQARYNLTNLTKDTPVQPAELKAFERLCQTLGLDASVATRISTQLGQATAAGANTAAPLAPKTLDQLTWLGVDASSVQTLKPYVVILPTPTSVNVNTASKEVLIAVIENLDASTAERIVQTRQKTPFNDVQMAFNPMVRGLTQLTTLDVRSMFFEVHSRLRLADHVLAERSLVERSDNGQVTMLSRERVASLEQVGP